VFELTLAVALSQAAVESAVIASVRGSGLISRRTPWPIRIHAFPPNDDRPSAEQAKNISNRAKSSCNRVRFDLSSMEDSY
jgi:hypothetical protein